MAGKGTGNEILIMPVRFSTFTHEYSFPPPLSFLVPLEYAEITRAPQKHVRIVGAHSETPRVVANYKTAGTPSDRLKDYMKETSGADRYTSKDNSVTLWFPRNLQDVVIFGHDTVPETATISSAFVCFSNEIKEDNFKDNSVRVLYNTRKPPGHVSGMDYSVDYSRVKEPVRSIVEAVLESRGIIKHDIHVNRTEAVAAA
ncbi:MAG: hypothetical protein HY362_04170 [Candidatus Aenigmarchaeota archaeon]|nr:hypothetical protein [Candidatus Aenigmarchaeota archaeon]